MLKSIKTENILFIDIETVSVAPDMDSLPDPLRPLWEKKASYIGKENETPADVFKRAGIYAEFGKIVCISAGFIFSKNNERCFRIKSFAGDDEAKILLDFSAMLEKWHSKGEVVLCAHNGKEFDFPYIARRMIIHSIPLPAMLDVAGKKPWEVNFLDTLELWKFGDHKAYTSLNLLAVLLGLSSPKDGIDGSMVTEVYWKEKDISRIVKYCENDVLTVARVLLRFKNEEPFPDANIEVVS